MPITSRRHQRPPPRLLALTVLRIRFERVPKRTWLEAAAPAFARSSCWLRVTSLVSSRRFDYAVDLLLVVAGGLLIVEERDVIDRQKDFDSRPDSPWNVLEVA
jgi:hypothetical protein